MTFERDGLARLAGAVAGNIATIKGARRRMADAEVALFDAQETCDEYLRGCAAAEVGRQWRIIVRSRRRIAEARAERRALLRRLREGETPTRQ